MYLLAILTSGLAFFSSIKCHQDKYIRTIQHRDHGVEKRQANNPVTLSTSNPPTVSTPPTQATSNASTESTPPPQETSNLTTVSAPPNAPTTNPPTVSTLPTEEEVEDHKYYTKKFISDPNGMYWNELIGHTKHELSNEHYLKLSLVNSSFNISFYGHPLNRFGITTQGFLYMSSFLHDELDYSHSRYVAPLMANFDTIGNDSEILYKDDGNSFVVEWRNVKLNDQPGNGNYTFQTTLFKNGTILFAYKSIPTTNISSKVWPVKVGIADAFYYDVYDRKNHQWVRWIVRYHAIEINVTNLAKNLAIVLDPLPTCNLATNCSQCTSQTTGFNCSWCQSVSRCSDGIDWHRQEWLTSDCTTKAVNSSGMCTKIPTSQSVSSAITTSQSVSSETPNSQSVSSAIPTSQSVSSTIPTSQSISSTIQTSQSVSSAISTSQSSSSAISKSQSAMSTLMTHSTQENEPLPRSDGRESGKDSNHAAAIVVPIVLGICLLLIGGWVYYARTHPTSSSGLWLIKNRPSQIKERISERFSKINFFKGSETGDKVRIS